MKHLSVKTMQAILLIFTLSLICEGCSAQTGNSSSMFAPIDSTMRAEVGDSISALIFKSKKVVAERVVFKNDTLTVKSTKRLKAEEASIVKFLFATNESFRDSAVVFGKFAPSIRLTFKVSKKVYCTAYVDFGLKQICLRDNKGEVIKMFGIKDDSFIKFANVIFPNDEFLMFMLNQK